MSLADEGYERLGRLISEEELIPLRARAEDLMFGRVHFEGLFFQRDGETKKGFQGPSANYRKLEKLELVPEFLALIRHPQFERIARAEIEGPISIYRAVLFNKAPLGGSVLPWHQDAGRMWGLDRDPTLQVWLALDDISVESGCLEVVPGSHKDGLATPLGGLVPEALAIEKNAESRALALPARAGEVILLHNYVWHRSGLNHTGGPRRAFSVCYMTASTRCTRTRKAPRAFLQIFA